MIWLLLIIVVIAAVLLAWHVAIPALLLGGASFLVVGAPMFYLLIAAESCLLFWALNEDEDDSDQGGIVATVSLLIALALLQVFSNIKPFTYAWRHPGWVVVWLAGYLLVGGLWSIGKWWFAETGRFKRSKQLFLTTNRVKGYKVPDSLIDKWATEVHRLKTDPAAHKARFLSWIAYWPWSLVWTILNDPLKRAVRRIYDELQGVYQRITDRVWQT